MEVIDRRLGTSDIWIHQLSRGVATRFTTDQHDEHFPVWSPDGRQIIFGSDRGAGKDASSDFFVKASDGMDQEESFFVKVGFRPPRIGPGTVTLSRIWKTRRQPATTCGSCHSTVIDGRGRFCERGSRSGAPGSRPIRRGWRSCQTSPAHTEVYVGPLHGSSGKTQVSTEGGISPRWRRDGTELFFLSADGRNVMAARVNLRPGFKAGVPVRLFAMSGDMGSRGRARNIAYDVAPDGQRFLISTAAGGSASSRITVVLNWASGLAP